jgi:hypothetical protein
MVSTHALAVKKLALKEQLKSLMADGLIFVDCVDVFGKSPDEDPFAGALHATDTDDEGELDARSVISLVPDGVFMEGEGAYVSRWEWVTNEDAGIPGSFGEAIDRAFSIFSDSSSGNLGSKYMQWAEFPGSGPGECVLWLKAAIDVANESGSTLIRDIDFMLSGNTSEANRNASSDDKGENRQSTLIRDPDAAVADFEPVDACRDIVAFLKILFDEKTRDGEADLNAIDTGDFTSLMLYFQTIVDVRSEGFNHVVSNFNRTVSQQESDDEGLTLSM